MKELIGQYLNLLRDRAIYEFKIESGTMRDRDYPFLAMTLDKLERIKEQMRASVEQ